VIRLTPACFLTVLLFLASSCNTAFASQTVEPPSASECVSSTLAEAETLYRTRDIADHNKRAIALYDKILLIDPRHSEALWKLSRSYHWEGDRAETVDPKGANYERAAALARAAIAADPEGLGGHLMLGIAYGRIGEIKGVLKSLLLVSKIKAEIQIVLEKEPQNDVAHHVLGVLYLKLPTLLGGSIEKSIAFLEQAVRENPLRTQHYLALAQSTLAEGNKEKAIGLLEKLLSISNAQDPAQAKYDRKAAKALLAHLLSH